MHSKIVAICRDVAFSQLKDPGMSFHPGFIQVKTLKMNRSFLSVTQSHWLKVDCILKKSQYSWFFLCHYRKFFFLYL